MPSEPLIALALSLLISLAPFLPAAEKSAPEEEPAPAVEEQPALSAEQLAVLAQTPASWFDEPALLDALSKLPHYDETRAQRYLAYRTGGAWTLEQVLRIVNTDNDLPRFTAAVDADPDDGDLILVNKYSRLASDYVPEDLVTVEPAYSNGGKLKSEVNDAFCDLVEAMWAETGLHLVNASPYRSYQTQKNLYARYRTQYSEATTDRFSARAATASIRPVLRWTSSLPAARSTASRTRSSSSGCATTPTASASSCATATAWSTSPDTSSSPGTTATSASRPRRSSMKTISRSRNTTPIM